MADTKRPDEVTWFRCCNCKELRISKRVPRGWWVMVSGELACSSKCAREAHEAWKHEQIEAMFDALRQQQELAAEHENHEAIQEQALVQ